MSSHRHSYIVQCRSKQMILGAVLGSLGLLTACAGPPLAENLATDSSTDTKDLPKSAELDQDPIDPVDKESNITSLPPTSPAAPKETDMTVLVLEDRDRLALASRMPPASDLETKTVSRPEQSIFHYAFDAHQPEPHAEEILRQHGKYLSAHPDQKIYLTGHTDSQGAEAYNRFLSRLRASAAARILRDEGARDHQIELAGMGSDRPASPGDHAANRRLELSYTVDRLAEGPNISDSRN